MLKYHHIITRLSDRDKIRLLCDIDSLTEKEFKVLGIPAVKMAELTDWCGDRYPSPVALANTWNPELVQELSRSLYRGMVKDGVNLACIPGPKIRINPYRRSLSEDPILASALSGAYLRAAEQEEIPVCMKEYCLHEDEVDWLDKQPDYDWLKQNVLEAYRGAMRGENCAALMARRDLNAPAYSEVNASLTQDFLKASDTEQTEVVYMQVPTKETVRYIYNNLLFFHGEAAAVETALTRYQHMLKAIAAGQAAPEDLADACERREVISPEMLDMAVDHLLTFVHSIKHKPRMIESVDDSSIRQRALRESIVLLKNDHKLLPLKKKCKIALIGDMISNRGEETDAENPYQSALTGKGYHVTGFARGYNIEYDRSEHLLGEAENLAWRSDIAIVFLGFSAEGYRQMTKMRKMSIPANQQHLLDRLHKTRAKVVAVLPADCSPDVGLDPYCDAVLMAPLGVADNAQALVDVLLGQYNPCGKLANTVYLGSDSLYTIRKTYTERDGLKTGPFVAYRYYDTAACDPGYVFGHGLSYTSYAYSQLKVSADAVQLTVKNVGGMAGTETVQVYIGMKESAILRPDKILAGFARVTLAPGESKTLHIPVQFPTAYEGGKAQLERGDYLVYVGASLRDIRLVQTFVHGDAVLEPTLERRVDYIQTDSNILTHQYTLEAERKHMKKSKSYLAVGIITVVMAIILQLYCAYAALESAFFDIFSLFLVLCGVVFMIVESVIQNRIRQQENELARQVSEEEFATAEQIPVERAVRMFVKEFDAVEEAQDDHDQKSAANMNSEELLYINRDQTFADVAKDFALFAAESGYKIADGAIRQVFSALAASRLLLIYGMDRADFNSFMLLLSNYFDSVSYTERVDESYTSAERVLFGTDDQGHRVKTNILAAIEAARNVKHTVHFASLTDVHMSNLPEYFNPYIGYIRNPQSGHVVKATNERDAETTYVIPPNLWFAMQLSDQEPLSELPSFVAEVAVVQTISFEKITPVPQTTHLQKVSYYQIKDMTQRLTATSAVSEDDWKRVDRFVEYVNENAPYQLGNKLWLYMETYAYVCMACGANAPDALDTAVAAKLLPAVIGILKSAKTAESRGLIDVLEDLFGEEHLDACKKLLRAGAADLA
jgi:beta-glucosidase